MIVSPRSSSARRPVTTGFFSTKSFGPGHLVGAGIVVLGVAGLVKLFTALGRSEAEEARRQALPTPPPNPAGGPPGGARLAQSKNVRGQYGSKP
jgi:hypothetical protein